MVSRWLGELATKVTRLRVLRASVLVCGLSFWCKPAFGFWSVQRWCRFLHSTCPLKVPLTGKVFRKLLVEFCQLFLKINGLPELTTVILISSASQVSISRIVVLTESVQLLGVKVVFYMTTQLTFSCLICFLFSITLFLCSPIWTPYHPANCVSVCGPPHSCFFSLQFTCQNSICPYYKRNCFAFRFVLPRPYSLPHQNARWICAQIDPWSRRPDLVYPNSGTCRNHQWLSHRDPPWVYLVPALLLLLPRLLRLMGIRVRLVWALY